MEQAYKAEVMLQDVITKGNQHIWVIWAFEGPLAFRVQQIFHSGNWRLTYRIPLGIRHLAWHIINTYFFKSTCDPLYVSFGLTKNPFFKKSVTFFHSFIMIKGPLYISSWYTLFNNYQQQVSWSQSHYGTGNNKAVKLGPFTTD